MAAKCYNYSNLQNSSFRILNYSLVLVISLLITLHQNFRGCHGIHVQIANMSKLEVKWAYTGILGPSHWPILFTYCGGFRQSPINILSENAIYDPKLTEFQTSKMLEVREQTLVMENTGRTLKLSVMGDRPLISGGALPDIYQGYQFHFHWGERNKEGSEHTIDYRQYPMEMHFIFYKTQYENMSEALKDPHGIAIFATLFEIGDYNVNLKPILNCIDQVMYEEDKTEVSSFPLNSLFPPNIRDYYRYPGSLPVPDCNEVVIWTIFSDTLKLSQEQMDAFRNLKARPKYSPYQHDLVNNYRPQQKLYDRQVLTTHRRHFRIPKMKKIELDGSNLFKDLSYDEDVLTAELNKEIEKEMLDDTLG